MDRNLMLEVNNMRHLMGLEPLNEIMNTIEKSLVNLNETSIKKEIISEATIRPKAIKTLWDDIVKLGDNVVDSNISKKIKDVFSDDILSKFKSLDVFVNLRNELSDIINDANPGFGVQTQKNQLVDFFKNGKISSAVYDGFDDFIEGLDKEVRNYKLDSGETVEDFLRERQENITKLYKELETETGDILNDPKTHNINSAEEMETFIGDYKKTFDEDLPFFKSDSGEDILGNSMRRTYDPDNIVFKPNKVVDELEEVLEGEAKTKWQSFKDDFSKLIKKFDKQAFINLMGHLYDFAIMFYDQTFKKLLFKNAHARRDKWVKFVDSKLTTEVKSSKGYKYGIKPVIITLNKVLTFLKTIVDAGSWFFVPLLKSVRKSVGYLSKGSVFDNKVFKFIGDFFVEWTGKLMLYIYFYWPVAFWEGGEKRADWARTNIANVQTMFSWFYIDLQGTYNTFNSFVEWVHSIPSLISPEEFQEYKKELDDLQVKTDEVKANIEEKIEDFKAFNTEKVQEWKTKYQKAKKCLDGLGELKNDFLTDFGSSDDSDPDQQTDDRFKKLQKEIIDNYKYDLNVTDLISSAEGVLSDFITLINGQSSEEDKESAELVLDEGSSTLDEILKACEDFKKQQNEIKNYTKGSDMGS